MRVPSKIRVLLVAGALCASVAPNALVSSAFAQSADANEKVYHVLLNSIANQKVLIAQQEVFIAGQDAKMAHINAQLEGLGGVTEGIAPMIDKMVVGIEREINADFPFKSEERAQRLQRVKDMVSGSTASVGEKYRNVLNLYKIEVNYGQNLEGYSGNHPLTPTVRLGEDQYEKGEDGKVKLDEKTQLPIEIFDGDYLRYGRAAFVYLNKDNSDPLRFDLEKREWVPLGGAAIDVRRAIRISYGEVAPGVVMAPVVLAQ